MGRVSLGRLLYLRTSHRKFYFGFGREKAEASSLALSFQKSEFGAPLEFFTLRSGELKITVQDPCCQMSPSRHNHSGVTFQRVSGTGSAQSPGAKPEVRRKVTGRGDDARETIMTPAESQKEIPGPSPLLSSVEKPLSPFIL